jgi:hypothetical protein
MIPQRDTNRQPNPVLCPAPGCKERIKNFISFPVQLLPLSLKRIRRQRCFKKKTSFTQTTFSQKPNSEHQKNMSQTHKGFRLSSPPARLPDGKRQTFSLFPQAFRN